MSASIVDFDLTLTIEHTFPTCNIDAVPAKIASNESSLITLGAKHAVTNLREGVKAHPVLSLEGDSIFSIATHHNNPHFVAGYIQEILGKSVTPFAGAEGIKQIRENVRIGIKSYAVTGSEKLLLIAYIPERGQAFRTTRTQLQGKNEMISALLVIWQNLGLWPQRKVNFYDDDEVNIDCARDFLAPEVGEILVHHIDIEARAFTALV
jgi:hypothetical protein